MTLALTGAKVSVLIKAGEKPPAMAEATVLQPLSRPVLLCVLEYIIRPGFTFDVFK